MYPNWKPSLSSLMKLKAEIQVREILKEKLTLNKSSTPLEPEAMVGRFKDVRY